MFCRTSLRCRRTKKILPHYVSGHPLHTGRAAGRHRPGRVAQRQAFLPAHRHRPDGHSFHCGDRQRRHHTCFHAGHAALRRSVRLCGAALHFPDLAQRQPEQPQKSRQTHADHVLHRRAGHHCRRADGHVGTKWQGADRRVVLRHRRYVHGHLYRGEYEFQCRGAQFRRIAAGRFIFSGHRFRQHHLCPVGDRHAGAAQDTQQTLPRPRKPGALGSRGGRPSSSFVG